MSRGEARTVDETTVQTEVVEQWRLSIHLFQGMAERVNGVAQALEERLLPFGDTMPLLLIISMRIPHYQQLLDYLHGHVYGTHGRRGNDWSRE
jgi:hypothetical protein